MQKLATEFLKSLFSETDEREVAELLKGLAELLDSVEVRRYPPDSVLFRQGQVEDTFYILINGEVAVDIEFVPGAGKTRVATKGPGEFFGEIALVLDEPRSADVLTTKDSLVVELKRETFEKATRHYPGIAHAMKQVTIRQLDENKRTSEKQRGERPKSVMIFTSYSRQDEVFVNKLAQSLQRDLSASHIQIWLDQLHIPTGAKWDREIQKALNDCKAMLLVLSKHSVDSDNVNDEWNYCMENKKPIIPILKEPCDVPFRLRRLQYVDFTTLEYDIALARIHAALIDIR